MIDYGTLQYTHREALVNKWFGCHNRNCLDIVIANNFIPSNYSVVFFDVDNLKALNAVNGREGSSRLIAQGIARHKDMIYSVFSGDEMAIFTPAVDALGYSTRLLNDMTALGFTATFAIGHVTDNVYATLDYLGSVVDRQKDSGQRGTVTDMRDI